MVVWELCFEVCCEGGALVESLVELLLIATCFYAILHVVMFGKCGGVEIPAFLLPPEQVMRDNLPATDEVLITWSSIFNGCCETC